MSRLLKTFVILTVLCIFLFNSLPQSHARLKGFINIDEFNSLPIFEKICCHMIDTYFDAYFEGEATISIEVVNRSCHQEWDENDEIDLLNMYMYCGYDEDDSWDCETDDNETDVSDNDTDGDTIPD